MPKLLLALLAIVVVAPAYASQATPAASSHKWPCPIEQAELAAAGYEPVDASTVSGPVEGSFFDPGQRSGLLP